MINIVTSNEDKFNEISFLMKQLLHPLGVQFNKVECNVSEIQGESYEIALEKCKEAYAYTNGITVVDDTSFSVDCMNGLPGAYIRDFFLKLGNNGFYRICKSFGEEGNITATEECYIAICKDGQDVNVFSGEIRGSIVPPDNSEADEYNWNYFFITDGSKDTYGRMSLEEKCKNSARKLAIFKLCEYIKANNWFKEG
jgi:inosine triphosphate pyrophosphatase